jgi:hypothetical protein
MVCSVTTNERRTSMLDVSADVLVDGPLGSGSAPQANKERANSEYPTCARSFAGTQGTRRPVIIFPLTVHIDPETPSGTE